jgi:Flp pilus assembly protein TadG
MRIIKLCKVFRRATARRLAAFRKREDGVAAVEFALILPIMATMFMGAVEMSWAVSVDRRVSQVASSTGDLIARVESDITQSEVLDIAKIGSWLMKPYDETKLKLDLSVVTSTAASETATTQRWKCTYDSSSPNAISCTCPTPPAYTIPAGLIGKSDGVVVADVTYNYLPLILAFDNFMKVNTKVGGYYQLKEKLHIKPRSICPKMTLTDGTVCPCF